MTQIICENLSIGYEGRAVAKDINFKAEEGDYICIVGDNGSGKSTLIKAILGLNKPISGRIKLDIKQNQIGYLPQQSEIQKDFPASVKEVVYSGFVGRHKFLPFCSKEEKRKASFEMERLEISDLADRSYRELSGGQQQRVFLARALCAAEKMIVLDEPVTGLDPKVSANMYEIISEINKRSKITVVMVSHDVRAAMRSATHILHVGHDETFFGTVEQYMRSETAQRFLL